MDNSYFLSLQNPTATVDQRDLEAKALALMASPELRRARQIVTMLWRQVSQFPAAEQWDRFDNMIDEYLFHFALHGANGDPGYPRVLRIMTPPCQWFGRTVPGSRWGGDSPDFIYRIIPIELAGQYRIHGDASCPTPPSATYSLVASGGAAPVTQAILDSLDLTFAADGSFVITIDDQPANGRANHLQTKLGGDHLLVRDALGDWLTQTPNRLQVERLDVPDRPPRSDEQLAQQAARMALNAVYYAFFTTQSGSAQMPNDLRAPQSSAPFGGMASQWGTKGNLCLEDDEALIVTGNGAGAGFRNIVLHDLFFLSLNHWQRTGSLNMAQMAADDNGDFTFVVAHEDPCIHNWLDTGGLRRTILGHRWQAFSPGGAGETPTISSRLVKFRDLHNALPGGIKGIDSAGRKRQLADRAAGFRKRYIDQ